MEKEPKRLSPVERFVWKVKQASEDIADTFMVNKVLSDEVIISEWSNVLSQRVVKWNLDFWNWEVVFWDIEKIVWWIIFLRNERLITFWWVKRIVWPVLILWCWKFEWFWEVNSIYWDLEIKPHHRERDIREDTLYPVSNKFVSLWLIYVIKWKVEIREAEAFSDFWELTYVDWNFIVLDCNCKSFWKIRRISWDVEIDWDEIDFSQLEKVFWDMRINSSNLKWILDFSPIKLFWWDLSLSWCYNLEWISWIKRYFKSVSLNWCNSIETIWELSYIWWDFDVRWTTQEFQDMIKDMIENWKLTTKGTVFYW